MDEDDTPFTVILAGHIYFQWLIKFHRMATVDFKTHINV